MPITANAKTYYIMDNREGRPLVDENDNDVRSSENLMPGDIIYCAPNKYEVISVEKTVKGNTGYDVNCRCLINKSKDGKFAYIIDETKFNGFRDWLIVKEFDKNAFNSYKNSKKLYISISIIPSWITKRMKNLSEVQISESLVKKNTFAKYKKLESLSLGWCTIEKNAFANCRKLSVINLNFTSTLEKDSFKNVKATIWYDNGIHEYDRVKGDTYKTVKSIFQIKKELKNAGFKNGTVVYVQKYNKRTGNTRVYKTIRL